jgi:O-antigen ligase
LWVALAVWLLMLTSFASFRSRAEMDLWSSSGFDLQVKFQALTWVALGCLAAILVLNGRADLRLLTRGPLFWFSAFTGLAVLSAIYSDSHALTAFRATQLAVGIVLVTSLREHLSRFYLFAYVFIGINWLLFAVANLGLHGGQVWLTGQLDAHLISAQGTGEGAWRMQTAYGHPSILSIVAAMALAGIAARAKRHDWTTWGPLAIWMVLTLGLTISRTAIVGALAGLVVVALGRRLLLPAVLAVGVVGPILMFPAPMQALAAKYFMRGQTAQEFRTLTGRAEVYATALSRASEAWHTGYGFASNRKNLFTEHGEEGITHAHNLVLEALTGTGVLGVATALLVLVSWTAMLWWIWQRRAGWSESDSTRALELCGMLLPVLAFCILDRGFVSEINAFLMLFMMVLAQTTQLVLDHEPESLSKPSRSVSDGRGAFSPAGNAPRFPLRGGLGPFQDRRGDSDLPPPTPRGESPT